MGRAGLYLEDLYVHPAYRGRGYGRLFLRRVAQLALERDCRRLEWCCLGWNDSSVRFYREIGARPMDGWTLFRLDGENLENMANC